MPVAPALKLCNRPAGRIRPQLDGLRRVLAECGEPQLDFPSILIVGTNGKGSTAAMLEAVLRAHGLATGLFTSPHLLRIEERIRLDGAPVDSTVLETHVGSFDDFPDLTFFETLTAAAFTIFSKAGVDVAVLEAGMGGSWDATRIAESTIAGLTNVGSDHAEWLGDEPPAVARDKGRALAAAERAVLGSGIDETLETELGAPGARRAGSLVTCLDQGDGKVQIGWDGFETVVRSPLLGDFQFQNLELAVALALEAANFGMVKPLEPSCVQAALRRPGQLTPSSAA